MRRFLLRDPLIFLLILFILTAAAGLAAAEIQYEDYRQKIEIISELVAAEMSAEEWNSPDESPEHPVLTEAVQLLKGHGEEHIRGEKSFLPTVTATESSPDGRRPIIIFEDCTSPGRRPRRSVC